MEEGRGRRRIGQEMAAAVEELSCGGGDDDDVDRQDPLLITTVKARLNREEKLKKVGRKTVKRLESIKGGEDEEKAAAAVTEEQSGKLNPRRYQQESFKAALSRNIILYLETGGGKTLVAVLLIKGLAKHTRLKDGNKRLIVFLAPTVLLVQQQSRVVKIHTDLKVGEYYGARNVDNWNSAEWEAQVSEVEVMVMTPQILLNNLQHGFMKMDVIELLIFDECHHAYKNHAYAQIMKGFYHINVNNGRLPKIFGMTASPVTKKGVKTFSEAAGQLSGLEDMLKSEVFTLKDREEVEFVAPTASTIEEHYDAPNLKVIAPFKESIEALLKKYEKANNDALTNLKIGFKDQAELIEKLKDKISKFHRDLQFCLEELGLWCAYKAAEHSFKVDSGINDFEGFGDATQVFKRNKDLFLKESLQLLQSAVPEGWATVRKAQELQDAVNKGYLTPKLYQLIAILFQKRLTTKDAKCIIFVERRMAAVVIASLVNQVQCLSEFLLAKSICGANAGVDTTRGQQQSTVAAFNQGEVNLLVATDIAEEGIDVQTCSEVIRFSLPKTLRSNIQSRGRARQQGSSYTVFLERGNVAQKEQFSKILKSEPVMREEVISREHMPVNNSLIVSAPPAAYRVASTGASVTPDSSVNLILRFCGKLPSDKFYMPKPEYIFDEVGLKHRCNLKLPPTSPIHEIRGEPQSTPLLAKQLIALEACKQLHQIGALNENLVPSLDFELGEEEEKFTKMKNSLSGVGTTMQKELYPSEEADVFTGNWHISRSGAVLNVYFMSFNIQPAENEAITNFVLLVGSALEDDVAELETELLLTRGRKVSTRLSPCGTITLSADQLDDAKIFQTVLFNGMFSKMARSTQGGCKKRKRGMDVSSLFIEKADLWKPGNAYLILPAITNTSDTAIPIDWKSIQSTSNAMKNLSHHEDLDLENIIPPKKKPSRFKAFFQLFSHRQEQQPHEGPLTLAGGCRASSSQLADVAVLTLHTMMIYPVVSVLHDTTAQSPFPFSGEGNPTTYTEFFKTKYGLTLQYPNQPLLQLKQNHRAHNLLPTGTGKSDKGEVMKMKVVKKEVTMGQENGAGKVVKVVENAAKNGAKEVEVPKAPGTRSASVEMPPELCLVLGFSAAVIRSAYWLPSVMNRIKAAALASQLRRCIQAPKIPVMEVLKALTTTRCNENFNMEALELFGDSFLKYAVSRKLFLELRTANEGILSTKRMHRICNRALHQLAIKRGLSGYIRDCPFDPSRWVAPGMLVSREVTCRCKESQMFKAFKSTTSKVIGMFGSETLTEQIRRDTIKPRIGLTCDKGHRYLCSKTLADVMEALIGAYLEFGQNCTAALKFMIWAGIDVDFDSSLMKIACEDSPVDLRFDYGVDVEALEKKIGYRFKNKYLPLEAMTHPSNMGGDRVHCYQSEFYDDFVKTFTSMMKHLEGIIKRVTINHRSIMGGDRVHCYQRLEFLGDAVLDFLLTRHLFTSHPTSTPGLLTSLRSASVNNERFARVAVKHRFHCYLRHGSGLLLHQIEEFAKSIEAAGDGDQKLSSFGMHGIEAPKVLGDLVESIAGAVAVDTCFDLDKVWAVMRPLLEPIVTPATLDMHPVTELEELCSGKAYNLKCFDQNSKDGRASTIRYEVQITEELSVDGTSCRPKKKIAKKDAAAKVLAKLKTPGFMEKFGKPTMKFETKLETSEALVSPPIAEELHDSPEKFVELCTRDNESGDENQIQKCGAELGKERVNSIPPTVDFKQLYPPGKAKPSFLIPCTKDKQPDKVQQNTHQGSIEKVPPKAGLINKTELPPPKEKKFTAAKLELFSTSATRLESGTNKNWGELLPKLHVRAENVNVQKEFTNELFNVVSQQTLPVVAATTKLVQGKVVEDVQQKKNTKRDLPLPARIVNGKVFTGDRDLKRKASHNSSDKSLSKFFWSQDTVVQTPAINSTELHSKRCKPSDEAMDLLNFCPWLGNFSSESFVQTSMSMKGSVEVLLPVKGLSPSPQSARKPVPKAKLSTFSAATTQGTKCVSKARTNCRQVLNEVRMKNKWSNPIFKLMNDGETSHRPRFKFSLIVDTGKDKYECQGEAKADKKQGMESVASAMLTVLKQSGVVAGLP